MKKLTNLFSKIKTLPNEVQEYIYQYESPYRKVFTIIIEKFKPIKERAVNKYLEENYNIKIRECIVSQYNDFYNLTLPNNNNLNLLVLTIEDCISRAKNIIRESLRNFDYSFISKYFTVQMSRSMYELLQHKANRHEFHEFLENNVNNIENLVNETLDLYGYEYFLQIYGKKYKIYLGGEFINDFVDIIYIYENK